MVLFRLATIMVSVAEPATPSVEQTTGWDARVTSSYVAQAHFHGVQYGVRAGYHWRLLEHGFAGVGGAFEHVISVARIQPHLQCRGGAPCDVYGATYRVGPDVRVGMLWSPVAVYVRGFVGLGIADDLRDAPFRIHVDLGFATGLAVGVWRQLFVGAEVAYNWNDFHLSAAGIALGWGL